MSILQIPRRGMMAAIGGGLDMLELIAQQTIALTEYTSTSAIANTTTDINISNSEYAALLVTITCDTPITSTSEWGATIGMIGRTSNGNTNAGAMIQQKGSATVSFASLVGEAFSTSYGVWIKHNTSELVVQRKCYSATSFNKIRAGNYTVKVYGLKSL